MLLNCSSLACNRGSLFHAAGDALLGLRNEMFPRTCCVRAFSRTRGGNYHEIAVEYKEEERSASVVAGLLFGH